MSYWPCDGSAHSTSCVYQLGPLRLRSPLSLPFSVVEDGAIDAELFLTGAFPAKSEQAETEYIVSWEGPRAWIRLHDQVAAFVSDGRVVCVDPKVLGATRRFAVQAALAVLLLQRGMLLLHGSAVGGSSGATVFLGPSGAGKSTAACRYALQGSTFLCDDLVPLFFAANGVVCTFEFDRISALVSRPHPEAEWISDALRGRARGVRFDGKRRFEVGEGDSTRIYPVEQTICLGSLGRDSGDAQANEPSRVFSLMDILDSLVCAHLTRACLGRQHLKMATRLVMQASIGGGNQTLSVNERRAIASCAIAQNLPCQRDLNSR